MKQTKAVYSSLDEMIEARNSLLHKTFTECGFDVKLIGDKNKPSIIVRNYGDRTFAISGFVKNFTYFFTDKPFYGNIIDSFKITADTAGNITREKVIEMISSSEVRTAHKIQLRLDDIDTDALYFNRIENVNNEKLIYWSFTDPRYFFSEQKIENTVNILKSHKHNVVVI